MELSTLLHVYTPAFVASGRTFWCPIRDYEFSLRSAGRPGLVNLATRIEKYRIGLDTEFAPTSVIPGHEASALPVYHRFPRPKVLKKKNKKV